MNSLRRRWMGILTLVVLSAFAAVQVVTSHAGHADYPIVLRFHTMIGNTPDFTINGVESDELPWVIRHAEGTLHADGTINLEVRGLVFANDPTVPANLRGTNDETSFKAIVSCMTLDATGKPVTVNLTTKAFPASKKGNSRIHDRVVLPHPCVAPIVFVVGEEGKWFAATGVGL